MGDLMQGAERVAQWLKQKLPDTEIRSGYSGVPLQAPLRRPVITVGLQQAGVKPFSMGETDSTRMIQAVYRLGIFSPENGENCHILAEQAAELLFLQEELGAEKVELGEVAYRREAGEFFTVVKLWCSFVQYIVPQEEQPITNLHLTVLPAPEEQG